MIFVFHRVPIVLAYARMIPDVKEAPMRYLGESPSLTQHRTQHGAQPGCDPRMGSKYTSWSSTSQAKL